MKTDIKGRLLVFAIWLAVIALLGAYIYSLVIADNNTRSALISVIAFIAITAITLRSNKQREIDAKHRKHKAEGYQKYIDIFIDMGGKHKKLSDEKFEENVLEFKKTLLTWGNEETIKTWNESSRKLNQDFDGKDSEPLRLAILATILKAIRKDLGHKDFNLEGAELLKLFIHIDEHSNIESIYNQQNDLSQM